FGRTGVRVNAVCPGGVNTGIIADFEPPEGASMSLVSRQYLDRDMQEPESVAAMIAYVASDEAYYVNGAILAIDGGTTTGWTGARPYSDAYFASDSAAAAPKIALAMSEVSW